MPHCLTSLSERRVRKSRSLPIANSTCRSCLEYRLHAEGHERQLDPNREGLGPCRRVLEGPEQKGGEQGKGS